MTSRVEWMIDPVAAWMPGYMRWAQDITEVVEDVVAARADEIAAWMQANHVWKNRTGLAEMRLFTALVRDGTRVMLIMGQGADVPYSRFLERFTQGGRFSILRPALDYWAPILLEDVRKALS